MNKLSPEQIDQSKLALGTAMSQLMEAMDKGRWANAMLIGNLIKQQLQVLDAMAEKQILAERFEQEQESEDND